VDTLPLYVRDNSESGLLTLFRQQEAAKRFGVTIADVEEVALVRGILPARYQRNRRTISVADQLALFRSHVAIVGCGGLGGYIIEELARLGVGKLTVIDPDSFEEHNLNRQILSTVANIGVPKVLVAAERIRSINPAVQVTTHESRLSGDNGAFLLNKCSVVVDALDSIPGRRTLAQVCIEEGVPLVHGSIAGWYGYVTTRLPSAGTFQGMFNGAVSSKGVEQEYGNPSFTPALVASLQAAEVCKLLLGKGRPLIGRSLMIDLLDMEIQELAIQE